MFHEDEVIMLLFGLGVLILILGNRTKLKRIPSSKVLIASFYMFFIALTMTVFEGFFGENIFNYFEHICYAGSSLLVVIWCLKVSGSKKEV